MPEINRTIQTANFSSDYVSVKDFGAVGDGVTDDTAAIQAAIDSGASIVEGRGTFLVDGAGISIQRDDLFLKLEKVKRTTAGSCIVVGTYTGVNATNVQVLNFKFEGAFEGPGYRSATEVIGVDVQLEKFAHYWFDRSTGLKTIYQSKAREGITADHPTTERTFIYRCEAFEVDYPIVCLPVTVDIGSPTFTNYAGRRELWLSNLNLARCVTNLKLEDVDGLVLDQFTLFQDPSDSNTRLDNIELHGCENVSISNGNCYEAGRNGIRISDCINCLVDDSVVVNWAGQQAASAGIYIFSRDSGQDSDNYKINATVHKCSGDGILIDGTSGTTIRTVSLNVIVDDNSNNWKLGGASLAGVYSGVNVSGVTSLHANVAARGNSRHSYGIVTAASVTDANIVVSSIGDVNGVSSTQIAHNVISNDFSRLNGQLTVNGKLLINQANVSAVTVDTNIADGYDVSSINTLQATNTVRSLTNFSGYEQGKRLTYISRDAVTTFNHLSGGAGQFLLKGAVNKTTAVNEVIEFIYNNVTNSWLEI